MATPPRFVVLVPLYIYPLEGAWEPLLRSAEAHPDIQFLAVVNPNNGPGTESLPDASYVASLQRLSRVPNIQPIGYVHCSYGKRPLGDLQGEIDRYAGWEVSSGGELRIDGIFVDEAPSQPDFVRYMADLAEHADRTWEASLGRSTVAVYNPGVAPSPAYYDAADYIVSFEQAEEHWHLDSIKEALGTLSPAHCRKSIAIIHSCAASEPTGEDGVNDLVRQVKDMGFAGLYLTHQLGGGFTEWPSSWDRFLEAAA